jgi:hypothetical protein
VIRNAYSNVEFLVIAIHPLHDGEMEVGTCRYRNYQEGRIHYQGMYSKAVAAKPYQAHIHLGNTTLSTEGIGLKAASLNDSVDMWRRYIDFHYPISSYLTVSWMGTVSSGSCSLEDGDSKRTKRILYWVMLRSNRHVSSQVSGE